MEITGKHITHRNIKGHRSMSSTLKTPDWASNYSKVRKVTASFKTEELEVLQDTCAILEPSDFELQIKAIKDELELRKTSLGRELL